VAKYPDLDPRVTDAGRRSGVAAFALQGAFSVAVDRTLGKHCAERIGR